MADERHIWAAGFLDGEGCFTLLKGNGLVHPATRRIYIGVAQVGREALDVLAELFGGRVRTLRVNAKGQEIFQWQITRAEDAARVCEIVLPYLIVKKRQAEILLAFAQEMTYRGKTLPPESVERRLELIGELGVIRSGR